MRGVAMGKEKHLDRSIACRFTYAIDLTTRQAEYTLCIDAPLLKELRHQPKGRVEQRSRSCRLRP